MPSFGHLRGLSRESAGQRLKDGSVVVVVRAIDGAGDFSDVGRPEGVSTRHARQCHFDRKSDLVAGISNCSKYDLSRVRLNSPND